MVLGHPEVVHRIFRSLLVEAVEIVDQRGFVLLGDRLKPQAYAVVP